jgi:type II secretory ATPase GspE/PulE/Tfp pilus assembly ATPase PilB-like protein
VVVRFRVDGVLHEAGRIPKEYYEGVVNRMKIASNMHIDEHFMAQDGAIRYDTGNGNTMDIRVSIVPIVDGEKIVLRLLSEYVRSLTLADLGFSEVHRAVLERASHKPFGMILTTGPTGSGKSTTLYALLKLRNHPDVNISTIEDPVEYKVPGINHIQVNTETNLTFANGLRALMRQDPNIILVGEIRDGETASIAVNAALTGHLLFSTLHANDAVTSVPRLLEMGVEPFLLASTLEVVIAQRLVRRICPSCRYSYSVSAAEIPKLFPHSAKFFESKKGILLYKGKGCEACGGIGYSGRIGIYELLIITPEIEELIVKRCSSAEIEKLARSKGMRSLFEDGFDKMLAGATTLEELLRVASPPDAPAPHVKDKKD